jgi:hypothetical protein
MSNQYGRIGHGLFLEIIYADPSLNVPPNEMLERITPESSANRKLSRKRESRDLQLVVARRGFRGPGSAWF